MCINQTEGVYRCRLGSFGPICGPVIGTLKDLQFQVILGPSP